ncbi:uncharacterized protein LOC143368768 [Andrena cerasifolii]|uniref:uncharacterized protein LOC143368768 n=1 Tax=Andrena cerasifolii TaxID=2819439 RepID=UPI004037A13C
MGIRLRAAKKAHTGIGGKGVGKLTNVMITRLTQYYGMAIRRNPNSAEDMKKAVWATYYHMSSTDAHPHHVYCPKESELLIRPRQQRCTGGNTQNNNESFNACVWTLALKHLHCGAQTVEIATYLAVCTFNNGYTPLLKLMNALGLHVGPRAKMFAEDADRQRTAAAANKRLLNKWKKVVENNGSVRDKYIFINNWTYDRFIEARSLNRQVTTRSLQQWAIQAANQFLSNSFHFSASHTWVTKFKLRNRITQRKVTRFVSKKDTISFQDTLQAAQVFQDQVRDVIPSFDDRLVINTDQTGCEYKIELKRTLSYKGEKITEVATGSLNKMTHSYTAQYAITFSGEILPKVFICLQEAGGSFGPRVGASVREQMEIFGNVFVTCTKSGKLQSDIYEQFLDTIIKPYVGRDKFLLILDSWGGQTNPSLYDSKFRDPTSNNTPTCTLKVIPPKCTPLCQPCDVYFFRRIKNFIARLQNAQTLVSENRDITDRANIIKTHAIIHNQLSAPIFKDMLLYAWYASKLSSEKKVFCNVNQVCFPINLKEMTCSCNNPCLIKCA